MMTHEAFKRFERLRHVLEGREAIYLEKGVLRVHVENIRLQARLRVIEADLEEIPTPGLEKIRFHAQFRGEPRPLRWSIAACHLTTFSSTSLDTGYGVWSLFFAREVVVPLIDLASTWTPEMGTLDRYEVDSIPDRSCGKTSGSRPQSPGDHGQVVAPLQALAP